MRHPFLRTLAGSGVTTDPNFENVTLLLHGDGTNGGQNNTFVDGSTNNFTITRNGNTTQGTFSPYGDNWSNYFDGNGDYLTTPSIGAFTLSGDFTIEAWVYLNTSGTYRGVMDARGSASGIPWAWYLSNTNKLAFYTGTEYASTTDVPTLQWVHIATTRSSNTLRHFVNGVLANTPPTVSGSLGSTGTVRIGSNQDASTFLNGYISNVRLVTGAAIYTSGFTPPTAPLTAISGTQLLTCQSNRFRDVSTNNGVITRNGDVSVQRFSPFSPTAAYAAGTIGGSGYFDGNGDDVSFPTSTAFELGTSDFTVEGWLYPSSLADGNTAFVLDSSFYPRIMWIRDAGAFRVYASTTGSSWSITHTVGVIVSQWNHLVFQRDGNNFRTFLNGTLVTTTTTSLTFPAQRSVGYVGRGDSTSQRWPGYIADMRVVKGTAVYSTSGFTPPTTPLTAITNTSLLLNFTNAAILDNAMMAVPETVGNAQIDTTTKKYGTGSMKFDGTGDRLTIPSSSDFLFGTGDWTVEAWVYIAGNSSANSAGNRDACIFAISNASSVAMALIVIGNTTTTGTRLQIVKETNTLVDINNAQSISQGVWHHIAACKGSNTIRLFFNGTQVGSNVTDTTIWGSSTLPGNVGSLQRTGYIDDLNGYIDDLRVTKGVARYTANFTPPTAAFPDL